MTWSYILKTGLSESLGCLCLDNQILPCRKSLDAGIVLINLINWPLAKNRLLGSYIYIENYCFEINDILWNCFE